MEMSPPHQQLGTAEQELLNQAKRGQLKKQQQTAETRTINMDKRCFYSRGTE